MTLLGEWNWYLPRGLGFLARPQTAPERLGKTFQVAQGGDIVGREALPHDLDGAVPPQAGVVIGSKYRHEPHRARAGPEYRDSELT